MRGSLNSLEDAKVKTLMLYMIVNNDTSLLDYFTATTKRIMSMSILLEELT